MSEAIVSPTGSTRTQPTRDDLVLRRAALVSLLVCLTYYLTARLGFEFALQPGSVSILWMPNSILLAGLLLTPKRGWWLVILSALPAHYASELQSGVPAAMVLSWFVSNSVQALIGALGINWLIEDGFRFDRLRDLTIFFLFGAFLAPFLSSFLDSSLLKLNGWGNGNYWEVWRIRFFSNVLASLTVVPAIVVWWVDGIKAVRTAPLARYFEATVLAVGLFATGWYAFMSHQEWTGIAPTMLYWPLPFLLWATVRFGPRGTSTSLLLVMFLAIVGAVRGEGPFVTNTSAQNALYIQWFLIVVSIPLMTLATVIEERRRAEIVARQNEERLTLALNAAKMGTWDWQIPDDLVTWSDETRRIFNIGPDDPLPDLQGFYKLIHPADREWVEPALSRALEEGAPYEVEFRLAGEKNTRWVLAIARILYDDNHNATRMVGVNVDITERKRADEALRQSEASRTRAEAFSLLMTTHVALDGTWLKVPPMLCELLGYSEQELLAGKFKDVTHPDDFETDWSQCQRLIRGEIRSFDLEKRYLHKDGHTIWVHLTCTLVQDDQGKPDHFLTHIKDITDRKLADQALLEINERNQAILRALPDMMFLHNREGDYLDYYARDPSMLAVPPKAFLGKNVREVMPAELADRVMDCLNRLDSTDQTQVLEYSLNIDGDKRYYEARLVAAEGDKALSIVREVTEARRAVETIRQSEEKLIHGNRQIRALAARLITAQESERRRISRLLHDDVSQNIAALGLAISRIKRKLPTSNAEMVAELDGLWAQANDLTTQIRRLSHQIHPDVLEQVGLVSALEAHVSEYAHVERIGIKFNAEVTSEPIPLDVSICLFRVALEALRNISSHSGSTTASISLKEGAGFLLLEVSDSGKGFDVEKARRGSGIGLVSAEERIKQLHGDFEILSEPQTGTRLLARIPLSR
jgi:PAS domain S-box-containing protein